MAVDSAISRDQFDVLTMLLKSGVSLTERQIAEELGKPAQLVDEVCAELGRAGYIRDNKITGAGLCTLAPFKVKRAIFNAAGFGSRLVPITLNTPKALVRVKGVRIIDTLIDAVLEAGIEEIIVARGYLKEQFDQLLYKYPGIKFIDNPIYNEAGSIMTAYLYRNMLKNAYVIDSDLFLFNKSLIAPYQYASSYVGIPVEHTDDWCFETKNGVITKMSEGGADCHIMIGISYWTEEDGARLDGHIKLLSEMPGGKECFWDQAQCEHFIKDYKIEIRDCSPEDVYEVDSFDDLKRIDASYNM